jgi:hypothetical protein
LALSFSILAVSCSSDAALNEQAYVIPERLRLKSSTAQASRVVAELKTGAEVVIMDLSNSEDGTSWSQIKGPQGESGWVESRYLVKKVIVDKSVQIADEIREIPTQAIGKSKASLKLRLTPDRETDDNVATLMPSGSILEIVGRERKPRPPSLDPKIESGRNSKNAPVKFDDWLLVRLRNYSVLPAGWIYGGSVELEIPGEILYFSSTGRTITGWQKIGTVPGDNGTSGAHYLVLERKQFGANEGVDFDRVKVLAYDPRSRDYSTPFRDDIEGRFPLVLKMQGTRGRFQLTAVDKKGQPSKIEYSVEMLEGGKVRVNRAVKR